MSDIMSLPRLGPYMGIQNEYVKKFKNGRSFRISIYGAFNAYGLIGSEKNGIVILDENQMQVLCDEICIADSGYFGATQTQRAMLFDIKMMKWKAFQSMINNHKRSRYSI